MIEKCFRGSLEISALRWNIHWIFASHNCLFNCTTPNSSRFRNLPPDGTKGGETCVTNFLEFHDISSFADIKITWFLNLTTATSADLLKLCT